ncbi:hypothetical protein [Streptomyces tailanensis]|uniref:hypothetical protein n=1 Tax=Streptomyces tailanensis TaxID=2569858 RepID=UPI00122E9B1A|nr:hypothetical protein [Streptomyces tailanensis]
MNKDPYLASAEQFVLYLAELQSTLDPESYELLLRILKGTNEALVHRGVELDIPLSPRERELFTPEFGDRLRKLLDHLNPNCDCPDAESEYLRQEVEAIARASGMTAQ